MCSVPDFFLSLDIQGWLEMVQTLCREGARTHYRNGEAVE
jgi:hypothetical protein